MVSAKVASSLKAKIMNSTNISLSVAEPWELGEALSWRCLKGCIVKSVTNKNGGRALIKLSDPLTFEGLAWRYVIAEPRHEESRIDALRSGEKLLCGFIGIAETQAKSAGPFDTENWRGGLSFIGDFELAP